MAKFSDQEITDLQTLKAAYESAKAAYDTAKATFEPFQVALNNAKYAYESKVNSTLGNNLLKASEKIVESLKK